MKEGPFEVTLLAGRKDKPPFNERTIGDKTYFEAVVGKQFKVKVSVNFTQLPPMFKEAKYYQLILKVDGESAVCCGGETSEYSMETIFDGYYSSKNVRAFKFADTDIEHITASHGDITSSVGQFEVKLFTADRQVERVNNNQHSDSDEDDFDREEAVDVQTIPCRDNKFWQVASASTTKGKAIRKLKKSGNNKKNVRFFNKELVASMLIPYHTASTLKLLHNEAVRAARRLSTSTENEVNEDYEEDSDAADDVEIVERAPREIPRFDLIKEEEEEQQQNGRQAKKARKQVIFDLTGDDDI